MNSQCRWIAHCVASVFWVVLVGGGSGCDALKSMTDKPAAPPAPPAPVMETPAPAPVAPVAPPLVVKTPQQIMEEFLALTSVEKTDENLKQVAELKEGLDAIKSLDLSRSSVSDDGMKVLTAFPKLAELNLSETRISNAGLASVAEVKSLRSITLVRLRGVDDSGIKNLAPLKDLESLTVSVCSVTDGILPSLAEFEGLQVLNLAGNPDIYGKDFKVLLAKGAFRNLRELIVTGSKFGFYGLEQMNKLPQLEVLRAGSCELLGPAISGLDGCDGLRVLDLSGNSLQDANMQGVSRLKKLEELRLARLNLTDKCLDSIKTMRNLKVLDLNGTQVTEKSILLLKEKFLGDTEILALEKKF